jgi:hypothetical protein
MKRQWLKLCVGLVVVVFFLCLARSMYIDTSFAARLPKAPVPSEGRTHELIVRHGVRVFASDQELRAFHTAKTAAIWSALIAVAVGGWYVTRRGAA